MSQYRGIRSAIALILASASIILAGCTSSGEIGQPGSGLSVGPNFMVSYAGAAGWLSGLDSAEGQEQVRDWARLGLASHLGMDTAQLRDDAYDTLPVRDPGFAGLAKQDIGPGRYLYGGDGVLHVLVPLGDPDAARTIGLQLDQYRTDAGTDAPQVQVHYYRIDAATDTIDLTAGPARPTSQVRAANGYVTMPVGTAAELSRFLARTSYLSRLELRGQEFWASGWAWPASQDARLTMADVSALQRGYTDAQNVGGQLPGFSLDPQQVRSVADLLAVIPGLNRDMANRVFANDWTGSAFKSAAGLDNLVQGALFGQVPTADLALFGLPANRTQLWALDAQLNGQSPYSQARYDGELAGTQVGMTMFYTDYVAKAWVAGTGTGMPGESVTGFVPNTTAPTVWSECDVAPTTNESGRLWFGENDSAVRSDANGISIGAQPTRLYARADGPHGSEVEPTYSFGRALLWWDQHYQVIADYDPEYRRLDQIMRWSDAIDWLVSKTSVTLPQLPDDQIPSNLTFADWYHQHTELRERSPIDFVSPPGAALNVDMSLTSSYGESVAHPPSKTFMDCGLPAIEGGISLGNSSVREGSADYHPDLRASVSRAGTYEKASTFDDRSGTGDIKQVSLDDSGKVASFLEYRFSTDNGTDTVDVTGSGRLVAPFGELKVWRATTALRTLRLRISASRGQFSEQVDLQGQDLGGLQVRDNGSLVTVQWRSGLLDRVRTALESVQATLSARPAAGLASATGGVLTDGVLYEYQAPDGQTIYRMAGADAPWLSITGQQPPVGDGLVFRGGVPNAHGDGSTFFYGKLIPGPEQHGGWLAVEPATPGHTAVIAKGSPPPNPGDPSVRVTTPDGQTTTAYVQDRRLLVRDDDPILGLNGSAEGAAMLRDFTRIDAAMRDAATARDGFLRAVALDGDGVALAGPSTVTLVTPDHPWAAPVEEAVRARSSQTPLILIEDGQALLVDKDGLTPVGSPGGSSMSLADALRMTGTTYFNYEAFRSTLTFEDGPVILSTLPLDTKVTVLAFAAPSGHLRPDVLVHHGANWFRASTGTTASQNPAPTPTPRQAVEPPAPGGPILLVCPAGASNVAGCAQ
jgi:hypothetical protein